jgi:hypothetical protein
MKRILLISIIIILILSIAGFFVNKSVEKKKDAFRNTIKLYEAQNDYDIFTDSIGICSNDSIIKENKIKIKQYQLILDTLSYIDWIKMEMVEGK